MNGTETPPRDIVEWRRRLGERLPTLSGWTVLHVRENPPPVPWGSCFREMDQRVTTAVSRFLPESARTDRQGQTKHPGRPAR